MPPTDPIADFLARLKNASAVSKPEVVMPHSKVNEALAKVLLKEGFLHKVDTRGSGIKKTIVVQLQYLDDKPAIEDIRRVSKPGRRVYKQSKSLRPVKSGFGVAVLSTPAGIMTDVEARKQRLGGEVICEIW